MDRRAGRPVRPPTDALGGSGAAAYSAGEVRRGVAAMAVSALALAASGASAHARHPGRLPLAVQSAAVTQSGQDIVWHLQMRTPFSPGALDASGGSLCLLIERVDGGAATSQLCLIGPRAGETDTPL